MKSGEKFEKVAKSGKKWEKVGISGESWGKVGKSWEKLGKVGKSGEFFSQNGGDGGDGGATKNIISPKFENFGDIIIQSMIDTCIRDNSFRVKQTRTMIKTHLSRGHKAYDIFRQNDLTLYYNTLTGLLGVYSQISHSQLIYVEFYN